MPEENHSKKTRDGEDGVLFLMRSQKPIRVSQRSRVLKRRCDGAADQVWRLVNVPQRRSQRANQREGEEGLQREEKWLLVQDKEEMSIGWRKERILS